MTDEEHEHGQVTPVTAATAWARAAEAFAESLVWLGAFAMICVIIYLNVRY